MGRVRYPVGGASGQTQAQTDARYPKEVDSVSALRGLSGAALTGAAQCAGYESGDGVAMPLHVWNPTDARADDGGGVIKPASVLVGNPGRWNLARTDYVDPCWWGAKMDASADVAPAVAAAIASLPDAGGVVVLNPRGRYLWSTEVVVARSGIVIEGGGSRFGPLWATAAERGSYVLLGANITGSMIRFPAHSSGHITMGNAVRDLAFHGNDRAYSVDSVVTVEYGAYFDARNLNFEGVKGRCLWTKFCIKGTFGALDALYCGDTAKPAYDLDQTSALLTTQGCTFDAIKAEVCFGASYLRTAPNATNNKFSNMGFEAIDDTSGVAYLPAASVAWQPFVENNGFRNQFVNVHGNRLDPTATGVHKIVDAGNDNTWNNINSGGGAAASVIYSTGVRNRYQGVYCESPLVASHHAVELAGTDNSVEGLTAANLRAAKFGTDAGHSVTGVKHVPGGEAARPAVEGPRRTNVFELTGAAVARLRDHFASGNNTSGAIGQLGWLAFNASFNIPALPAGRFGVARLTSTATAGVYAYMIPRLTPAVGILDPSLDFDEVFVVRAPTNVGADFLIRVGLANDASANPPADGLFFEKLGADANWFRVARGTGVQTRQDTGVALSTTPYYFLRIRRYNATTIGFAVNEGTEALITTNVPTASLMPVLAISNVAAAATRDVDVDDFDLRVVAPTL